MFNLKNFLSKIRRAPKVFYRRHIDRPLNQIHRYDFTSENNGWKKYGTTPIWGNSQTGTMFDPYVFEMEGKLNMVVSARKTKCLILIESMDGIIWKNPKILLQGRSKMWDDDINRGCLIKRNNYFFLWYTGQYNGVSCIGFAQSIDGKFFNRILHKPVLKADFPCEGVSVMNPCVLWDESAGLFKMWYSAGENYEPDVICYAESEDGIKWNKRKQPVLTKHPGHKWEQYKIGGCNVVKNIDGSYEMYYIGYQNVDVARICIAHSKDGVYWSRDENNLLLSPSKKSWDSDAVYKPSVIKLKEKDYLWYNGRRACEEYIGLAIKTKESNGK